MATDPPFVIQVFALQRSVWLPQAFSGPHSFEILQGREKTEDAQRQRYTRLLVQLLLLTLPQPNSEKISSLSIQFTFVSFFS